jgi:hypothetical protein
MTEAEFTASVNAEIRRMVAAGEWMPTPPTLETRSCWHCHGAGAVATEDGHDEPIDCWYCAGLGTLTYEVRRD